MIIPPLWKKSLYTLYGSVILLVAPFAYAACPGSDPANSIPNPLSVCSFLDLVKAIANAVVVISMPIAAVAIIFVGLRLVIASARGDSGEIGKARKLLLYIVIGTVLVVGASSLAIAVINTIKNITA